MYQVMVIQKYLWMCGFWSRVGSEWGHGQWQYVLTWRATMKKGLASDSTGEESPWSWCWKQESSTSWIVQGAGKEVGLVNMSCPWDGGKWAWKNGTWWISAGASRPDFILTATENPWAQLHGKVKGSHLWWDKWMAPGRHWTNIWPKQWLPSSYFAFASSQPNDSTCFFRWDPNHLIVSHFKGTSYSRTVSSKGNMSGGIVLLPHCPYLLILIFSSWKVSGF